MSTCERRISNALKKESTPIFQQVQSLLRDRIPDVAFSCPSGVGTGDSLVDERAELRQLSRALFIRAKKANLAVDRVCGAEESVSVRAARGRATKKNFKVLLKALKKLPDSTTVF
jgi:hypothetical protein